MIPKEPINFTSFDEILPLLEKFALVLHSPFERNGEVMGNQLWWLKNDVVYGLTFIDIFNDRPPGTAPLSRLRDNLTRYDAQAEIRAMFSTKNVAISQIKAEWSLADTVEAAIAFFGQPYTPRKLVAA